MMTSERKYSLADKVFGAVIGLTVAGTLVLNERRFEYDRSPFVENVVSSGETLSCYAKFEKKNIRLSDYSDTLMRANDFWLSNGRKAVGENGNIYSGRKLLFPDINKDGRVGCLKD